MCESVCVCVSVCDCVSCVSVHTRFPQLLWKNSPSINHGDVQAKCVQKFSIQTRRVSDRDIASGTVNSEGTVAAGYAVGQGCVLLVIFIGRTELQK